LSGSGLDTIYPPENKYLFEEVIKNNGAIISEYTFGTKPFAREFSTKK